MTNTKTTATAELFEQTSAALWAQKWGQARALLDDLGLRSDNTTRLRSAEAYGLDRERDFYNVIQDRIDLVNARAMINARCDLVTAAHQAAQPRA